MNSYKGTIQQLIAIELDILKQSKASPWFAYINKEAVKRFYIGNEKALKHFENVVNSLNASFVNKDEHGEILLVPGENGKLKQAFISEEAEKCYKDEMAFFGNAEILIFY